MSQGGKWIFITTENGRAIECSKCGRKISVKDVMFADEDISTCPKCNAIMDLSGIDEDDIRLHI